MSSSHYSKKYPYGLPENVIHADAWDAWDTVTDWWTMISMSALPSEDKTVGLIKQVRRYLCSLNTLKPLVQQKRKLLWEIWFRDLNLNTMPAFWIVFRIIHNACLQSTLLSTYYVFDIVPDHSLYKAYSSVE